MAASGNRVASEDSSSSDDEELKRCQEAVWDTQIKNKTEEDSNEKKSKRIIVAEHKHDGNELQVTEGFQTHVAKKLGHYLDSCISETQHRTTSTGESPELKDEEDEGFRLFSTSVPGQKPDDPPAPPRRRPIPSSSSDSEMEERLKEAAVSIGDLIPSSIQQTASSSPQTETPCGEKKKKKKKKVVVEGESDDETKVAEEEIHAVKKKKKRKKERDESNQKDCRISVPNSQNGISEQNDNKGKCKKKKKKKMDKDAETLN